MPNDEPDLNETLNRAVNALEHIACSLVAIELMQAAQDVASMTTPFTPTAAFSTRDARPAVPRHRTRQN